MKAIAPGLCIVAAALVGGWADELTLPVADYQSIHVDLRGDAPIGVSRGKHAFWDASTPSGDFSPRTPSQLVLDWGDTPAGGTIDCFQFYYATDAQQTIDIDVTLFARENGHNSTARMPLGMFRLLQLPGGRGGVGTYSGWAVTVTPPEPIAVAGPDVDGDGRVDFGYSFHFRSLAPAPQVMGPSLLIADPDLDAAPGIEDRFDRFSVNPGDPPDPNAFLNPADLNFDGSFFFSGDPYAQFRFQLLTLSDAGCPSAGCESADIEPAGGDCDVDISDLAACLFGYGTVSGATREIGDVEPSGGDGDVDIADLAILINSYGTICD